MKQYIKSSSVIICVALALAGCSKTEEFYDNPDSALQIESVSGISPFALMQETASKAVITGNTLPDSVVAVGVGIFVTESDGGAYDGHAKGYANVNFANSGSGWQQGGYTNLSEEGKVTWRAMENAGAVCLPAAGYRNDKSTQITDAGSKGRYWTATTGSTMFATYFSFTDKRFDSSSRQQAYAVRLVKESK